MALIQGQNTGGQFMPGAGRSGGIPGMNGPLRFRSGPVLRQYPVGLPTGMFPPNGGQLPPPGGGRPPRPPFPGGGSGNRGREGFGGGDQFFRPPTGIGNMHYPNPITGQPVLGNGQEGRQGLAQRIFEAAQLGFDPEQIQHMQHGFLPGHEHGIFHNFGLNSQQLQMLAGFLNKNGSIRNRNRNGLWQQLLGQQGGAPAPIGQPQVPPGFQVR